MKLVILTNDATGETIAVNPTSLMGVQRAGQGSYVGLRGYEHPVRVMESFERVCELWEAAIK